MSGQIELQQLLRRKLTEHQTRNPRYSVRAFSKRLGMQPAATNEILKGERRVSIKIARKIADRLQLDPTERATLLRGFEEEKARPPGRVKSASTVLKLSADQFEIISEGLHYLILSLIRLPDFRNTPAWIAKRTGRTVVAVRNALGRLKRLGLLEERDGRLVRTFAKVNTSDDLLDLSIQKSHLADMEIAREALLNLPVEVRDFTSLTFPVDLALLPRAKEILRKAQDEIADLMETQRPTEVYRLTSYLYPLTRFPAVHHLNQEEK